MDEFFIKIKKLVPDSLLEWVRPIYHWGMAFIGAVFYRFPSKKINVIAVTGTKGKSSTTEILNKILETAGYKTALSNTIRFKVGNESRPNLHKMSMPGRFTLQKLLRQAVDERCTYMVMEMTSQGSLLYRHHFIHLDTLIFTNISPEHIEAHGSYENYLQAKLNIARYMSHSCKKTTLIVNSDDAEHKKFLACKTDKQILYSLKQVEPYHIKPNGFSFTLDGHTVNSPLSGIFNLYNTLSAITAAKNEEVADKIIIKAVENHSLIPGRVEKIECGQDFTVVVDYAHTPDSLEKIYRVFRPDPKLARGNRIIAILGGTGGGRDNWKRVKMGELADTYCDEIILTDEDPYDEDPRKIVEDVAKGITNKKPQIIMDRKEAIHSAINMARTDDIIIITGKGTDPYIMGPNGTKTPWSDSEIARKILKEI